MKGKVVKTTSLGGILSTSDGTVEYRNDQGRFAIRGPHNRPQYKHPVRVAGSIELPNKPKFGDVLVLFIDDNKPDKVYAWVHISDWERVWNEIKNGDSALDSKSSNNTRSHSFDWSTALEQAQKYAIAREEERMERFVGPPKPPVVQEDVDLEVPMLLEEVAGRAPTSEEVDGDLLQAVEYMFDAMARTSTSKQVEEDPDLAHVREYLTSVVIGPVALCR